jgi:hypothetical protein
MYGNNADITEPIELPEIKKPFYDKPDSAYDHLIVVGMKLKIKFCKVEFFLFSL